MTADLDLLRLYLCEIGRYGRLSPDDEVRLGQEMEAGRAARFVLGEDDTLHPARCAQLQHTVAAADAAAAKLLVSNLRLVVAVAKQHRAPTHSLLDAIADGNLGLLEAVEHYDWRDGRPFSSRATWFIRKAISRGGRVGRALSMSASTDARVRTVYRALAVLEQERAHPPTVEELADATGLSAGRVARYLALGIPAESLDALPTADNHTPLGDIVADPVQPSDTATTDLVNGEVQHLLERLEPSARRILELRFGLNGATPHTYAEVGAVLGVSAQRVRQIEMRTFARLRRTVRAHESHALLAA